MNSSARKNKMMMSPERLVTTAKTTANQSLVYYDIETKVAHENACLKPPSHKTKTTEQI